MDLNVDVAPTLLELAGVPVPAGLHGRSFVPLLEGRDLPWRDAFLYEFYEYPGDLCVRKNRGVRTTRPAPDRSRSPATGPLEGGTRPRISLTSGRDRA